LASGRNRGRAGKYRDNVSLIYLDYVGYEVDAAFIR